MARMGVFSRNNTNPEPVPRSVQDLSHRNTFSTKYMMIVPNFARQMYPNESIRINVTNFVRTIPMNTPMFSSVRIVQRFIAVPNRIMWSSFEDYIKGDDEFSTSYEEPYIVNSKMLSSSGSMPRVFGYYYPARTASSETQNPRCIELTSDSYVASDVSSYVAQFGSCELGDYLDAPLYTGLGRSFTSGQKPLRMSAFKFAAYQLGYSYFYRQPNVQARIDDFYQMSLSTTHEFPMFVLQLQGSMGSSLHFMPLGTVSPSAATMPAFSSAVTYSSYVEAIVARDGIVRDRFSLRDAAIFKNVSGSPLPRDISSSTDPTVSTYRGDLLRSSWDKVEHFPLKAGANLSMLASEPNPTTGLPEYVPSNISLTRLRYANWQTDYFTSENPWQQRGEEQQIPVNGTIKVNLNGVQFNLTSSSITGSRFLTPLMKESQGGVVNQVFYRSNKAINPEQYVSTADNAALISHYQGNDVLPQYTNFAVGIIPEDLASHLSMSATGTASASSSASAVPSLYVSPSQMKFALAIQHIQEAQAQIDNRYQSYIRKFFGARARDFRLDRPEFIGGSVQDLNISEVEQTSADTDDSTPLGTLAGKGVSGKTSKTIRYHAEEHTMIMGLIHIIPDTEYIHGLNREDNTQDRFDWMLPQLGHLPEQAVYNYELSCSQFGIDGKPYEAHGYEPMYNNLRWQANKAHGEFRDWSNSRGNYAYFNPWLIKRDFGFDIKTSSSVPVQLVSRVPTLSDQFLSGRYGVDNSNFVSTNDDILHPFMVDSYFNVRMVRTIPTRGTVSKI